jgi:hypothetical protein
MEFPGMFIRDDFVAPHQQESGPIIGQIMESSRRYLLQAEIEYWHEMVRLNQRAVSKTALNEMRSCLKKALRDLHSPQFVEKRIAA